MVAIGGEPEETTVCEERGRKDFISFLAVGGNLSVLADTSPIFAEQNTVEEVNTFLCIVFVFLLCAVVAIGGEPEETTVC